MPNWLLVTLLFIALILFLIFMGWLDWKYKCRKTVKENDLHFFLTGYMAMKEKDQAMIILDGVLGVNDSELIFANRFKEEEFCMAEEFSHVSSFDISEYDEDDFLGFMGVKADTGCVLRNMLGITTYKRIPGFIKKRMICKIRFGNTRLCFCYKNTEQNTAAIERLKTYIRTE